MLTINQNFSVSFSYDVHFTRSVFHPENPLFANTIQPHGSSSARKVLVVIDEGLIPHYPSLFSSVENYAQAYPSRIDLITDPVIMPGGEKAKTNPDFINEILEKVNSEKIDRHSYIVAIGGGAVIDAAGYAAAISHRGVRLIRIPTTVLAQNDASVGVKNGVNAFGKKNFIGTFAPPRAVLNDFDFLRTLKHRDWISGISEAVKVALLKDAAFFDYIDRNAEQLFNREEGPMERVIYECARLHLEHISGSGDPFEMGSSRPLDFGHWAAHKLEQLTNYELRHGEAVAVGLALDVTYSYLEGTLPEQEWDKILDVLRRCGFRLFVPELKTRLNDPAHPQSLLHGLEEFREHLGGRLTIMLLEEIGEGKEVNEVEYELYRQAIQILEEVEHESVNTPQE